MLWNVAKFTEQDASDIYGSDLHTTLGDVIVEYVHKVKRSLLNYSNINLSWTGGKTAGPVHVLMDNYCVGEIYMAVVGNSWKIHACPESRGEMTPTVSKIKALQFMMAEFRIPTPEEDGRSMAYKVKEAIRVQTHISWKDVLTKFNDGTLAASGYINGPNLHSDALIPRLLPLLKLPEAELTPAALKSALVEWIDRGVFEAYEEHIEIEAVSREFNAGSMNSMYVREWSDGSGAIVKTEGNQIVRHICKNLHEQMPAEYASKLAMLKVSGLNFIAGAGVRCDSKFVKDGLTETVYYLI